MSNDAGFINLEENIKSTIYEGLLKLGYQNNESFSIYYDLDLLNHLLLSSFDSNETCLNYLQEFKTFAEQDLLDIEISLERNRFKFSVDKDGIEYIYKHENNPFLNDLIQTVSTHSFHLEDILAIFKRYSDEYICEEIDNDEFQYVLYFKDSKMDKFKYCFTFDEMGGYYHRLLDFSFNKILNE